MPLLPFFGFSVIVHLAIIILHKIAVLVKKNKTV